MITAQQFWLGAIVGPVMVAVVVAIFLGTTKRAITASEGRIIDRIDRVEADIVDAKGELRTIHARVTGVEKDHAQLRGEFNTAVRPDSKSGLPKFQK